MTLEMEMGKGQPLFEKRIVAELSEQELMSIDGGTTIACAIAGAGAVLLAIEIAQAGYAFGKWMADN